MIFWASEESVRLKVNYYNEKMVRARMSLKVSANLGLLSWEVRYETKYLSRYFKSIQEKRKLTADDDDSFEDSTWGSDEGPGFARPLK